MSDPVQQTVVAQIGPVETINPLEQVLRIGEPLRSGRNGSQWVEFFDDASRIAGRYRVGRNIVDDHRSGPDDTVFAYLDALADDGTVSDPGIGSDPHLFRSAHGQAVIQTVPVAVGYVDPAGKHAVVFDNDLVGRTDADPRADQAIVADGNAAAAGRLRPDRQPDLAVWCGDHGGVVSYLYRRPKDFNVPGLDEMRPSPESGQSRAYIPAGVELLEFQVAFLDEIRTVVTGHGILPSEVPLRSVLAYPRIRAKKAGWRESGHRGRRPPSKPRHWSR